MIVLVEWLFWKYSNNQILYNDILCMECVFEPKKAFGKCMYENWNRTKTSCGYIQII